jgi:GT2 family glycosyltransferase
VTTTVPALLKVNSTLALVNVLIPTCGRKTGLAVVLTSLLGQTFVDFDVVISDQTADDEVYLDSIEIRTLIAALRWRGHRVETHRHLPRRGMAEQRAFLLSQSCAQYVHYVDDDVLLEPDTMARMLAVIQEERCGFVGCAATGLEHLYDVRPHEQGIELWGGPSFPKRSIAAPSPGTARTSITRPTRSTWNNNWCAMARRSATRSPGSGGKHAL